MVATVEYELLTLEDAAILIDKGIDVVQQRIEDGDLPVIRLASGEIRILKRDLAHHDWASQGLSESNPSVGLSYIDDEDDLRRNLSPDDIQARLEAIYAGRKIREHLLQTRGGKLFPPSWEIVREMRDER